LEEGWLWEGKAEAGGWFLYIGFVKVASIVARGASGKVERIRLLQAVV